MPMLCGKASATEVKQRRESALRSSNRISVSIRDEQEEEESKSLLAAQPVSVSNKKVESKAPSGIPPDNSKQQSIRNAGKLDNTGASTKQPTQKQPARIRVAASVQPSVKFTPHQSNPRPPEAQPFKRLVLVSSRVHEASKIAEAVLPDANVLVYDWQGSLADVKQRVEVLVPKGSSVTSIAVLAPGDTPACADLVTGYATTRQLLGDPNPAAVKDQVLEFWRLLGSKVAHDSNGVDGGRRIDLIGCRLADAPVDGAALLKELWQQCAVPFACADESLRQYALTTWRDSPKTGKPSLVASTHIATDLYFDRSKLFVGTPSAVPTMPTGQAAFAPKTGSPNSQLNSPPAAADNQGRSAPCPPPGQPHANVVVKDIFTRFKCIVQEQQWPLDEVFKHFDTDDSGFLNDQEVRALVCSVCQDATATDAHQVVTLMDLDGNNLISFEEFKAALERGCNISAAVREGRDDTAVVEAVKEYFLNNKDLIRARFHDASQGTGRISSQKLTELVTLIIEDKQERHFLLNYLYQVNLGDGSHTYESMLAALNAFGTPKAMAAMQKPAADVPR